MRLELGLSLVFAWLAAAPLAASEPDFERQIRPLLMARCGACHGADEQEGGLRLDARQPALRGGDGGPVIVPGSSAESRLWQRVSAADPDERMPPDGEALSAAEQQRLAQWIDAGAPWPETAYDRAALVDPRKDHWAFQPLRPVAPPAAAGNVPSPIDRFVAAELTRHGLKLAERADRITLARRATLDLWGLPPEPAVLAAFAADDSEASWSQLIERLLASPRYGERWGQHWLDVVRYADTHGFEVNTPREHAWPYRDYVIGAFTQDLPYNRFIVEQLAGDAVGADPATGFLVASAVLLPGQIGADDVSKRQARHDSLDEIVSATGATFLGLTIGCARCHDHKFDPLTQHDYYALEACFAGVEYGDRPIRDEQARRQASEAAALKPKLARLDRELETLWWVLTAGTAPAELAMGAEGLPKLLAALSLPAAQQASRMAAERAQLWAEWKRLTTPRLVFGGTFRGPDPTFVLRRGDPEQPVSPVGPAAPAVLGATNFPSGEDEQARRLALAHWIASPDNPLTARVMVNRLWTWHFGRGLVDTPSDFGLAGGRPSHPALLDWLANELIQSGWSVKHIHRLILHSATYRQSSRIDPRAAAIDRENRWLWRFASRRLEGEAIRDSLLAVSGELNLEMGGPGFDFFQSRGGLNGFPPVEEFAWPQMRRMVYSHKVRMERVPVFGVFDCPDAGQATPVRSRSTTAIQALNLLNSPFVIARARALAGQISAEVPDDPASQVGEAFRRTLGRQADLDEFEAAVQLVGHSGLAQLCRALVNSNEFLFLP